MYVTTARQLDEITLTEPVTGQLFSGYPTEVEPGTYPVMHDPSDQPTDGDLVAIDVSTGGEDDFYPRPVYISVCDDGTPRTSTVDFGGLFAGMSEGINR
jgi:hypothetical protein